MSPLEHENQYLKLRVAQLQEDVTDLSAELTRLRQKLEHIDVRRTSLQPNPLGGGQ